MKYCIHALITGKVQGVYFRDHTCRQGKSLQLTGWVKNLPDGRVETVACGSRESVMAFAEWLKTGSPKAEVKNVCWEELPQQTFSDFTILY